ncbi:MAG: hypothetical protein P8J27_15525 [Mariniblastus sp.]|nr:hypothetical protein [Mariniblastus sp.]
MVNRRGLLRGHFYVSICSSQLKQQAAKNAATGESWSISNQPLMTPEEIRRFFSRDDKQLRQLVLRPGYHPAILQRVFYDKHELFRGKCYEA